MNQTKPNTEETGMIKKITALLLCTVVMICACTAALAESEVYLTIQSVFANPESEYYVGDAYVSDYDQLDYVAFYYNYDTKQLVLGGKEQITFWQDVELSDGLYAIGCICQTYNYFTEMEPDTMLVIGFAGDDEEQQIWIDNAEDALAFVEMITGLVTEE